jgi:Ca-activated chloride channel family protein
MEGNHTMNDDGYKPNDYTLERWLTVLLALLFLLPFIAHAQELPTTTLDKVEDASLLLKTGTPGLFAVAPNLSTEVSIRVTGPVVRTSVRQTFRNTTGRCVEGLYVFPLPEMSAVDTLEMMIGARTITGEIREKQDANRVYQKAKSEGRKAALIEQHRPNVFTTSVASILPDEIATITIEYQETARYEKGEYRLRFPMVVAPRYNARGTPYSLASMAQAGVSRPQISVDLQPGYSVAGFKSNYQLTQQIVGDEHYQLAIDQVDGDRDLELVWRPDLGSTPEATVLTEKIGDQTFALIVVTPPPQPVVSVGRETVFIIDSSGSMQGGSMEQARSALLLAIDNLRPGDRFNVIDFDSEARALFDESRVVDATSIETAREFVRGLDANGGTEMLSALKLALPSGQQLPGTVRQVIFMTDGQVGNEQELFTYIHSTLGESRLFTVGIGSAPNSHFMRNAARFGRGTFTYIGDLKQVQERMGELFEKLSSPAMTSIEVQVDDPTAEMWPSRIPDLYTGEPLVVAVRVVDPSVTIALRGRVGGQQWSRDLRLPPPGGDDSGIARLWARQKIEFAMDRLSEGVDPAVVRAQVIDVALRHHLVSQYTSLVAVDQTPHGLAGATCAAEMETNAPQPQDAGQLPQTATPAALLILIGMALIVVAWRLS